MKKVCLVLLCLMICFSGQALAAEWPEGTGPDQPSLQQPKVQDMSKNIGYVFMYPRNNLPAEYFCDTLRVYYPRMDLTRGTGSLQLYRDDGTQVFEVNFQDEDLVSYRDMTENEMQGLRWGSGMVFEIHLPVSLELGENYHVAMDQGCIVGVESNVPNPHISNRGDDVQKWTPWVQGDFGVSGLRYLTDQEDRGISEDEETGLRVVVSPEKDDVVQFDLVLGGAADTAIIYCPDNSVLFEQTHFTYSTTVSAKVIADEVTSLGVMFMDEDGNLVQWVDITPITLN